MVAISIWLILKIEHIFIYLGYGAIWILLSILAYLIITILLTVFMMVASAALKSLAKKQKVRPPDWTRFFESDIEAEEMFNPLYWYRAFF